ncbi:MAG: hypothetical protein OXQ89_15695 [Rhodospirillaceae bacterium]|nr:hypothetical protein [Rhodospirillaceae bacterium]MDD9999180.1 hypothetical protein [Rhodospirillaceae bacterium]MDE0363817.1 hypothetical protein [Rhodospirillaceae bacterium]
MKSYHRFEKRIREVRAGASTHVALSMPGSDVVEKGEKRFSGASTSIETVYGLSGSSLALSALYREVIRMTARIMISPQAISIGSPSINRSPFT